jgi:hypothetical protein
MPELVTRNDLRSVLREWAAGRHSPEHVHQWAERRFADEAWECEDDIANEVLAQLDMLDINLVTPDDLPALLVILQLPTGQARTASATFGSRLSPADLERRRKELAEDPTYGPFCRS